MKRPIIPSKPDAPSVHPVVGPAIERARRLSSRHDERQMTDAELVADIEQKLRLPPGIFKGASK